MSKKPLPPKPITNPVFISKVEDLPISVYEEIRLCNNQEAGTMMAATDTCRENPGTGIVGYIYNRTKTRIVSCALLYKVVDGNRKSKDGTPKYLHMIHLFTLSEYRKKGYNSKVVAELRKQNRYIYGQHTWASANVMVKFGILDADARFSFDWVRPGEKTTRYA